jgi:hypothetical protein
MYALSDTLFLKNYDKKYGIYSVEESILENIYFIGKSDTNIKIIDIDDTLLSTDFIVDKNNWIGGDTYDDIFHVNILNGKCTVQRIDKTTGWGIFLRIKVKPNNNNEICIGSSKSNSKTITIKNKNINDTFIVNKKNWLDGEYQYNDTFEVNIKDGNCFVKRLDKNTGWDKNLKINYSYIHIGPSDTNTKIIDLTDDTKTNAEFTVNKFNWIGQDTYDDTFNICIKNGKCIVKRIDTNTGWDMDLRINKNPLLNLTVQILKEVEGKNRNHYDSHNIYDNMRIFNNRYESWDCTSHSFK